MADGGFRPRDIDEFTLLDVRRLFKHWGKHPSASTILAVVHGIKTADQKRSRYDPSSQSSPAVQKMIAENIAFMEQHGIRLEK